MRLPCSSSVIEPAPERAISQNTWPVIGVTLPNKCTAMTAFVRGVTADRDLFANFGDEPWPLDWPLIDQPLNRDLLEFHRRAEKPQWWDMFARTELPFDITSEGTLTGDIGGSTETGEAPRFTVVVMRRLP